MRINRDVMGFALVATVMLGGGAQAQQPSHPPAPKFDEESEIQFNGHCRECHSFVQNDNRLGPSLYGVVGRKAGSVPGFNYSDSSRVPTSSGTRRLSTNGSPIPAP